MACARCDLWISADYYVKFLQAYQFGNSVATRFYRRILPKVVFGAFESDDDNEDRRAFAAAVGEWGSSLRMWTLIQFWTGVPELLKKVSIEFSQIKDEVYAQKISFEGEETIELIFMLGDSSQFMVKGKTFKVIFCSYPRSFYRFRLKRKKRSRKGQGCQVHRK